MKRVNEERSGSELVDTFVDTNLGVFGLLRPPEFTGIAATDTVSDAVRAILGEFSFPSLNVVFSATSRLLEKRNRKVLKEASGLKLMEARLFLEPQDAQGNPIPIDPASPILKILALNPSETKAVKTVDGQLVPAAAAAPAARPKIQPDISSIVQTLAGGVGTALGIPAPVASAAANLALDFFGGDEEPEIRFPILEKATIAAHDEFAWFLRSEDVEQKEGTHFGTAFLQVNRRVAQIRVTAVLSSDWRKGLDNQIDEFETVLAVNHPSIPETPNITDFTRPESLPLVLPRSDVKTLLGINESELDNMINSEQLRSFGAERRHISKGSLIEALGL